MTATDQRLLPAELPLLALRSTIVFPHGTIAVQMGAAENIALLRANPGAGSLVALGIALGDDAQDPARLVGRIGVVARVKDRTASGRETIQVTLEGVARARGSASCRSARHSRWRRSRRWTTCLRPATRCGSS